MRAAATAAEEIGSWATLSGFAKPEDVEVLTDLDEPVTIARIAGALLRLLPLGTATDTLLLHFAGHGLREDNTRTLWLPTDWRTSLRAVAVERLKNRLSDFGVANVTIISDACKGLSSDRATSDLTPDGVLGAGISAGTRPIFDRFDAVHDVESAFMVPGSTPERSRCLFSGAVIEGLWGAEKARDQHFPGKVTPGSLTDYIDFRVGELCRTYRLDCSPQSSPGRPADHLIYFDANAVDAGAIPPPPEWPAPVAVGSRSVALTGIEQKDAFGPDEVVDADGAIERSIVGAHFGKNYSGLVSPREHDGVLRARSTLDSWIRTIAQTPVQGPDAPTETEMDWVRAKARGEVERTLGEESRSHRADKIFSTLVTNASPIDPSSNLLLGGKGRTSSAVWSYVPIERRGPREWKVEVDAPSCQLVVEYPDGMFVPLLVCPGLLTIASRDRHLPGGWLFRSFHEETLDLAAAVEVMIRTQANELAPRQVDEVATLLRRSKHGNPALGAICSYLYDYVGDLESIRRMAWFYAERSQPIPYDVAMVGELTIRKTERGLIAQVPAVEERRRSVHAHVPDPPRFVTRATGKASGFVGGLCPWLRQGWDFVDVSSDGDASALRGLPDVRRHLLPATFTAFDSKGGRVLTEHWGMTRWE